MRPTLFRPHDPDLTVEHSDRSSPPSATRNCYSGAIRTGEVLVDRPARTALPTDITEIEWAALRRQVFTQSQLPEDLREAINAALFREQALCPWRLLPPGFPSVDRLRAIWDGWAADGTWLAVRRVVAEYASYRVLQPNSSLTRVRRVLSRWVRAMPGGDYLLAAVRTERRLTTLVGRARRQTARIVRRLPGGSALLFPGRVAIQAVQYALSRFTIHAKCPGWYRQGQRHMFLREFEEAIECFTKIIDCTPFATHSHLRRAEAHYRLRQYPEACVNFWTALSCPGLSTDEIIHAYFLLSEAAALSGDVVRGVEYGHHARMLKRQGSHLELEEGQSIGPDTFEILAEAHNDLAELAINANTDFETAALIYRSGEDLRNRYVEWLGDMALRTLFLTEDWVRNIGHIALLEFWVKLKQLGWGNWDRMVLLAPPKQTANTAYLRYFREFFHVVQSDPVSHGLRHFSTSLGRRLACLLPLPDKTAPYFPEAIGVVQQEWERQGRGPLLKLSADDAAFGTTQLRAMGLPPGAWFACIHVRSAGFYREAKLLHQAHRNADIRTYLPAIREIVRHGGWVIRLGDPSMAPLPAMRGVIDYARSPYKSARMDVVLGASARFFIGVTSGLCHLPSTFGVPCVHTNWVSNSLPVCSRSDLFLPKLLRREADAQTLTFDEWLSRPVRDCSYSGEGLLRAGLEVIDNTPDELREVVVEMLDRLAGRVEETPPARARMAAFSALADKHGIRMRLQLGAAFLKRHGNLLQPVAGAAQFMGHSVERNA